MGNSTKKTVMQLSRLQKITKRLFNNARYVQQHDGLEVVGRYVHVALPDIGVADVFAKVDTGAYRSAIHATDIHEVETPEGKVLDFKILDGHKRSKIAGVTYRAKEFSRTTVKNSFGVRQDRYIIKTRISINGRAHKTDVTLSNRKDMVAPMLIGRRYLRGRYIVDVRQGTKHFNIERVEQ